MKKQALAVSIITLAAVMLVPLVTHADVYMKYKRHTDAYQIMGQSQPAKDEDTIMWLGKGQARFDQGTKTSSIVRLDQKKLFIINHDKKTYTELPIADLATMMSSAMGKDENMSPEEKQKSDKMMQGMASMMQLKATVTATGEKKKINKWNAEKYNLTMQMAMGTVNSEVWATDELKIDYDLYLEAMNAMMMQQQGFKEFMEEMKKIKGVHVATKSSTEMMNTKMNSSDELQEFAEKAAPDGTYEIPKDYKETKGFK